MKFKFCGDLDCPDWVLAEINTLSKMSSIKMKLLCQMVAKTLLGEQLDEEKAVKLVSDAKLEEDDMKACVQALNHILTSSARYEVEEDALNSELQQLGLPKEHATALCKVYSENMSAIVEKLSAKSLRISSMEEVSCNYSESTGKAELRLKVKDFIKDNTGSYRINMTPEQLSLILKDLKSARDEMKNLPS
ncbi:UNVERIFIED_CONTAM: hypothetical protein PYX00_007377 [Menopon gallinae]|uniref:COMM domain-containing protein 4 n=1 Tax=Menopon gallinae TaxID=328185 RepID=A0AAW2HJ42_9NEOP